VGLRVQVSEGLSVAGRAVDDAGDYTREMNGTGSPATDIDGATALTTIACPSPSQCVATDSGGDIASQGSLGCASRGAFAVLEVRRIVMSEAAMALSSPFRMILRGGR
jgi:hypothetical protein